MSFTDLRIAGMASARQKFDARQLMERAIAVMRASIAEPRADQKASPVVGAVLWKPDGSVDTGCRGELRDGDHAEFTVMERKNRSNALDEAILFSTLEPCAPGARRPSKLAARNGSFLHESRRCGLGSRILIRQSIERESSIFRKRASWCDYAGVLKVDQRTARRHLSHFSGWDSSGSRDRVQLHAMSFAENAPPHLDRNPDIVSGSEISLLVAELSGRESGHCVQMTAKMPGRSHAYGQ